MPTYEYVCKNCGKRFDLFQPFSAKPLKRHDVCGGDVQRVIHPRGIVFKGSGFYSTDSRSKTSESNASSEAAASKSSGDSTSKSKADHASKSSEDSTSKSKADSASKSKRDSASKSSRDSDRSKTSSSSSDE